MSDDNEVQELRDFLRRNGFVPCDIPACNCGSWHGGHANQRLREISEALDTAGLRRNGETILADVVKTTMDNDRLRVDAERYRNWLRGGPNIPPESSRFPRWEVRYWDGRYWQTLFGDDLDAAIDAARGKE